MSTKKTTKKKPASTAKASSTGKCSCKEKCSCCCAGKRSQLSFYLLIAMLVATLTVLIMSVCFDRSVRQLFRPADAEYNGMFSSETKSAAKDESNITLLSAGAVIDMMTEHQTGFLIVCEQNDVACDAFARRVARHVGDDLSNIYRYNIKETRTKDDERALIRLGDIQETPDFVFISAGIVYDRIDDVKEAQDLDIFLTKRGGKNNE